MSYLLYSRRVRQKWVVTGAACTTPMRCDIVCIPKCLGDCIYKNARPSRKIQYCKDYHQKSYEAVGPCVRRNSCMGVVGTPGQPSLLLHSIWPRLRDASKAIERGRVSATTLFTNRDLVSVDLLLSGETHRTKCFPKASYLAWYCSPQRLNLIPACCVCWASLSRLHFTSLTTTTITILHFFSSLQDRPSRRSPPRRRIYPAIWYHVVTTKLAIVVARQARPSRLLNLNTSPKEQKAMYVACPSLRWQTEILELTNV